MKTKYNINKNELVVNLDFLYDLIDWENNIDYIRKYINKLINYYNINFNGNKIIIYKDRIYLGTFYLCDYYLKKFNIKNLNNNCYLTDENSYFYESQYLEINKEQKVKTKKVLQIY